MPFAAKFILSISLGFFTKFLIQSGDLSFNRKVTEYDFSSCRSFDPIQNQDGKPLSQRISHIKLISIGDLVSLTYYPVYLFAFSSSTGPFLLPTCS